MPQIDEKLTICAADAPAAPRSGAAGGKIAAPKAPETPPQVGDGHNRPVSNVTECPGSACLQPSAQRRQRAAAFALALLVFACANLLFSCLWKKEDNLASIANRTWSWWTLNDLNQRRSSPNVVLLGSSLMVAAIAECDANYKKKTFDMAYYRDAAYLSGALQKTFGGQFNAANLSAPGQMPSDAYLTLSAAIKKGVHPRVIFYGLAPRDFIDGTMQSPTDTEAFQVLQHFVNIDSYAFDLYLTPVGRLDWLLQKCSALYGESFSARRALYEVAASALPVSENGKRLTPLQLYVRRTFTPLAVDAGTAFAVPTTPGTPLLDNMIEYRQRYKNPATSIYQSQFRFLQRLADLCKENQIKLVLLRMPITQRNVSLIKPAVYTAYKTDLQLLAERNFLPLIDLCQFGNYSPSDYKDSVHLNGYGGKKFVDNLVSNLSTSQFLADQMVATSKSDHKQSLAASSSGI